MNLSPAHRNRIRREFAAGVPHTEIAESYGISVALVLLIGNHRDERGRVVRAAEPYQPKLMGGTARPVEARVRRGEACRTPECSGTVERGSYCRACAERLYVPREAA